MASARIFSARIVCIDYYMSPPIPGVDVLYSTFQGGKVNEVPVIRVYGPTPAGQKACLHIHKAFPYLYVPVSDVTLDAQREGEACANSIALGLEKALTLRGNTGSKRQHIHGYNLVRAKKLYGYHPSEELFVKIYLYYPQDVSRAANLLLGGAVLDKTLQPHESHIPFILQFMVDYNLYGMGHVHLSKIRFRHPVPSVFTAKEFGCDQQQLMCMDPSSWSSANVQVDTSPGETFDSPVWVSSAIPNDWMWHVFSESGASLAPEFQHVKRKSTCELEGDSTIDEIINQQFKTYTSLSQTSSDVKMVQSLVPIWEDEHQRTGNNVTAIPPDPGKPLPKDVLKTLLNSLEFELKLQELCCRTDAGPLLLSDDITRSFGLAPSFSDKKGFAHPDNLNCTDGYERTAVGISDQQLADTEALGLLRWLATSQAAEDINSDDELVRETILSPLLPATTMDKVLEKANIDFESESQKECQDILDSIKGVSEVDHLKEKSSVVCETTTNNQPPLGNDFSLYQSSAGTFSKVDTEGATHKQPILLSASVSLVNNSKGKRPLWGSLPLGMKVDDSDDGSSPSGKTEFSLFEDFVGKATANSEGLVSSMGSGVSESRMVSCSVRDLMRKKRQRRVSEQDNALVCDRKFVSGVQEEGDHLLSKRLEFHTVGGDEHLENPVALENFMSNDEDSLSHILIPESDKQNVSTNPSEKQHVIVSDCMPSSFSNLEKVSAESCGQESGPLYKSSEGGLLTGHDEDSSCIVKPLHSTFLQHKNVHAAGLAEELTSCSSLHKINDREPQASLVYYGEKEGVKQNTMQLDYKIQQKGLMDVSAHYQNDGSLLYLLTPSLSPPSADCVNEWLLHGFQDASGEVNAAFSEGIAIRGPSKFGTHSSCADQNDAVVSSSLILDCTPTSDEVEQVNDHKSHDNFHTCNVEGNSAQSPENVIKDAATDCSVDVSQISGPDGGSRSTPLSQIGFRDPASVGAGQQLTLLSVEVLAETRADLQPNPRFDAINIISLVFQCDIASAVEAYVLLRSNASSYQKNLDGVSGCKVLVQSEERSLFDELVKVINLFDPDIIMGWDVQGGSLGFLAERAAHLGIGLLNGISRTPTEMNKSSEETKAVDSGVTETGLHESLVSSSPVIDGAVIQDEWGRTHASGVHVGGRVVLNIWRLMRGEVRLSMYNIEDVCGTVLRRKLPSIPSKVLSRWFSSGAARYRCIEYLTERAKLNLAIMNQLDMVNRTSELARVFGIEFFSVLSRGSQYRVESMLLRLAHTQNYLAVSPGNQQVASQPAMECVPLVMEPESGFYADPVVVLDFQSLYPSMIIAYNLCFSTCLGNVIPAKSNILGVSQYSPDPHVLRIVKDDILLTPNGVMYVPSKTRKGVLPRLLDEILSTRIMVKQSMKKLAPSEQVLHRIQNARQLALKLIANVTYGYTAAGFSGRMPCAELADSIVQCGRCTLERAIALVNANNNWKAKVVYGDTDSMFVLLKGRSLQEAFQIGRQIASAVTAMNPDPVTLKLEKVYHPCFLLTKKRYVGYSYESPEQVEPLFDAKGIETVRRDTCGVVAKMMEKSLKLFFEHQDILEVKTYFERQWKRILSGRVSLQDFVFAKEVRLGTYSTRLSSSLPPAAIVASKAMRVDPRAEPRYAERVPYVVIHGEPGARLVDMVVDPLDLLTIDSPYRLNDSYYITKQIIPALQRVFGLLGADLNQWFSEMPRPAREISSKCPISAANPNKTRIDYYYLSKHCILCGELVHATTRICHECLQDEASAATALIGRTSKLEKEIQHLAAICRHCGGGDWIVESGIKCTSLACSVFYERRKVQKELRGISAIATERGLYPKCMVEWF